MMETMQKLSAGGMAVVVYAVTDQNVREYIRQISFPASQTRTVRQKVRLPTGSAAIPAHSNISRTARQISLLLTATPFIPVRIPRTPKATIKCRIPGLSIPR